MKEVKVVAIIDLVFSICLCICSVFCLILSLTVGLSAVIVPVMTMFLCTCIRISGCAVALTSRHAKWHALYCILTGAIIEGIMLASVMYTNRKIIELRKELNLPIPQERKRYKVVKTVDLTLVFKSILIALIVIFISLTYIFLMLGLISSWGHYDANSLVCFIIFGISLLLSIASGIGIKLLK